MLLPASVSFAVDSAKELRAARLSPIAQGAQLYKDNCVECHSETGNGTVQAALGNTDKEHAINKIKEGGGEMPSFLDKLDDKQVEYIAYYVSVIHDQVERGKGIFMSKCTLCHGIKGDGTGRASRIHKPPPANLTTSDKNDDYKRLIITYGGEYMGRNPAMPVWGEELSEQQVEDVIQYTNSIRKHPLIREASRENQEKN